MFTRRSFPRSIYASLIVVYSSGAGVVPNGILRKINARFSTISMHVDTIWEFVWIFWYVAPRSVFPIKMDFGGHLRRMNSIMWRIWRSKNMQKHVWRVSLITLLFTDMPDETGNYQL